MTIEKEGIDESTMTIGEKRFCHICHKRFKCKWKEMGDCGKYCEFKCICRKCKRIGNCIALHILKRQVK